MALTPTTDIPLGFAAPDFSLPDTLSGDQKTLTDCRGDVATVMMFICNHCPFVIHVKEELVRLAKDYQDKGISFVAISSNNVATHPQDGPEQMKAFGERLGFSFPYLYDESQEVARAYDAACTPDFSIFDRELLCVYRGQLDDSRPGDGRPVNGADIRAALDALLAGKTISADQKPSVGCNIKWK